jgi:hypothetical protein
MLGNAAEWCLDEEGNEVLMGTSWQHTLGSAGLKADERFSSNDRYTAGGRLVCDLPR